MPQAATKSKYDKISKSYILTPPNPQGHGMSVKCEEPLDELTVNKFGYCLFTATLIIGLCL